MAVRPALLALLWVAVAAGGYVAAHAPGPRAATRHAEAGPLHERAGTGLTFDASVAPADRAAVLGAIAAARPEARRLIESVDGLVDVRVGEAGGTAAGTTSTRGGRFEVVLDLGFVSRVLGPRGISRLVLHELGHVVDFALIDDDLMARLQAGIPAGYGCEHSNSGACAAPVERFAESFAKWATGDIGVDLSIGYKVPPPLPSLEAWGAPLARLGS